MILFFIVPPIVVILALAYATDRRNRRRRTREDEGPRTLRTRTRTQQRNDRVMDPSIQAGESMNHGIGGIGHGH